MKIAIELEVDQEAYNGKYGPGTEWWGRYQCDRVLDGGSNQFGPTYHNIPKPAGDYSFAPDKAKGMWNEMLKDILTEGLYDWTQLHEEALKITITIP